MTSAKARAANRENAKKSTGPRTAEGKRRASRNALQHGLSAPLPSGEINQRIEILANIFAAGCPDPEVTRLARRLALAELQLVRVREERARILHNFEGADVIEKLRLIDRYFDRARRERLYALRAFARASR